MFIFALLGNLIAGAADSLSTGRKAREQQEKSDEIIREREKMRAEKKPVCMK